MKMQKRLAQALGIASLLGLVSSQALAGTCTSSIRNFPAAGVIVDAVIITCRLNTGTESKGSGGAFNSGGKKIIASKDAGAQGQFARGQGLDANGVLIAGCDISDPTANGVANTVACAAAVKTVGSITFPN
jgi:hypothetical protein